MLNSYIMHSLGWMYYFSDSFNLQSYLNYVLPQLYR